MMRSRNIQVLLLTLAIGAYVASGGQGQEVAPADLPRVDQLHIVHAHEAGTRLWQAADGSIHIDQEPAIWHEGAAARRAAQTPPIPMQRVRLRGEDGWYAPEHAPLAAVDALGRPWFLSNNARDGLHVTWIEQGELRQRKLGNRFYVRAGASPYRNARPDGAEMLVDGNGVWVAGIDRLYRIEGEQVTERPLPTPDNNNEERDLLGLSRLLLLWTHQLYRFNDELWLVRSMTTNSRTPGSFVIRFAGEAAQLAARSKRTYVQGLVFHRGVVHVLVAKPDGTDQLIPESITALEIQEPPAWSEQHVRQSIADLGHGRQAVRDAASAVLRSLPMSQAGILQEALQGPIVPEQRVRLQDVLRFIEQRQKGAVTNADLAGAPAAELMFTDYQGRQYVRLWDKDAPTQRLMICDGGEGREITAPSPTFQIDCQGADGRLYGHDERWLYVFDPDQLQPQPIADLGDLAGWPMRVAATHRKQLCLALATTYGGSAQETLVWVDLDRPDAGHTLAGQQIADGLPVFTNASFTYPVVAGPGNLLWFVRTVRTPVVGDVTGQRFRHTTQILQAQGQEVRSLSEPQLTNVEPSVWPLTSSAAIIAAMGGTDDAKGVLFHDGDKTHRANSLAELLLQHWQRLLQVMPDGAAFHAGDTHNRTWLIRLGDGFFVEEVTFLRWGNGAGYQRSSGIFRNGAWVARAEEQLGRPGQYSPVIHRVVGLNVAGGRILGFQDAWTTLRWIPISSKALQDEVLVQQPKAWAWTWINQTPAPRFEGGWMLTPDAAARLVEAQPQREAEAEARGATVASLEARYRAEDMPAFRRWTGAGWREVGHTLYGGSVWEDAAGGVWHMRVGEAEVTHGDGHRQIIELDVGMPQVHRLVVESRDAVWVASQQVLTRYSLRPAGAGDGPEQAGQATWVADRRLRLPRLGAGFAGPWIVGKDFYYASNGGLYHCSVEDAIAAAQPLP